MAIFNRPLRAVAGGLLAPDPPVMGPLVDDDGRPVRRDGPAAL